MNGDLANRLAEALAAVQEPGAVDAGRLDGVASRTWRDRLLGRN